MSAKVPRCQSPRYLKSLFGVHTQVSYIYICSMTVPHCSHTTRTSLQPHHNNRDVIRRPSPHRLLGQIPRHLTGGLVWCGVVWCGVAWCGVAWVGVGGKVVWGGGVVLKA